MRARPWIALLLPPLAWFSFEIGLGAALRLACAAGRRAGLGVAGARASLLVCAGALAPRVGAARDARDARRRRRLASRGSRCSAPAIFALAIVFQTLATLIVPPCAR